MARYNIAEQSFNYLRVVTQRLTATPTEQLPHIAPYLATTITECKAAFAFPLYNSHSTEVSGTPVLVHKLKTQLSALLQDKSPSARYAAVILIKATIEVGGWSVFQGVGPWVTKLITILGKPDPAVTKKLCIITLTRTFLLTHGHQSLTREITTPSLAAFIMGCLDLVKAQKPSQINQASLIQNPLRLDILQAFSELITLHPSSFRPFMQQIQAFTFSLLAPTPLNLESQGHLSFAPGPVSASARRLYVMLHVCAPRNTASEEWKKNLQTILASAQRTADRVFRATLEDWRPPTDKPGAPNLAINYMVSDQKPGPLTLPSWTGIYAGVERLDGLLHTLQVFLASTTSAAVALPATSIMSLVSRVLSASPRNWRTRAEFSRDEREGLEVGLPRLHLSAMTILSLMISRMGNGFAAMSSTTLEQMSWLLGYDYNLDKIQKAAYGVISQIFAAFGPSLPEPCAKLLSPCIRSCCEDLLPSEKFGKLLGEAPAPSSKEFPEPQSASTNVDSYLGSPGDRMGISKPSKDLLALAQDLLCLTLTCLPPGFLSYAARAQIDRTAILTGNKAIMLASVMNPPFGIRGRKQANSILPMLARKRLGDQDIEAMLRPRMPMVQLRRAEEEEMITEEEAHLREQKLRDKEFEDGENKHKQREQKHLQNEYRSGGTLTMSTDPHISYVQAGYDNLDDMFKGKISDFKSWRRPDPFPVLSTSAPGPSGDMSHNSNKRDREDGLSTATRPGSSEAATFGDSMVTEEGTSSKRARLAQGERDQEEVSSPKDVISHDQPPVAATPKPSITQATGAAGAQFDREPADTDESDFEMPTLHLEPDTDEEDDEEEEDENDV